MVRNEESQEVMRRGRARSSNGVRKLGEERLKEEGTTPGRCARELALGDVLAGVDLASCVFRALKSCCETSHTEVPAERVVIFHGLRMGSLAENSAQNFDSGVAVLNQSNTCGLVTHVCFLAEDALTRCCARRGKRHFPQRPAGGLELGSTVTRSLSRSWWIGVAPARCFDLNVTNLCDFDTRDASVVGKKSKSEVAPDQTDSLDVGRCAQPVAPLV